jgi:TonB-dependent starch-binding outer membrane protein SusC
MTKFYLFSRYFTVLLLFVTTIAWSQSKTVTGQVTSSDDGSGLPGVNVVEKGTSNGTVTDADGKYSITVGENSTIVFSFVGYKATEMSVGNQSTINVGLESDVTSLSEIVVVGYGTQEKKELTSSVASVKAEDFNRGTVNDPVQLLQGKVAGLNITRPGGDPNGGFNIRLRGVSTIGANSSPLVVIDGVIGGSLSTVDPNDIESIDVLKDGSAAAIYGSRGGSGVILVTTKSGKSGKATVDYNGSFGFESIANTMETMSADEYRQVPGAIDLGSDTDWLEEVTQGGRSMIHNISLGGGGNGTTYRASFNYRTQEGIAINSGFDQINGRLNISQKALKDKATFNVNLSATNRESEYGFTESLRYAVIANPTMPVYDDDPSSPSTGVGFGNYAQRNIFDFFNPLAITEQNVNEGKDQRYLASVRGEYDFSDIVDGFRVALFYSNQRESDLRGEYYSKYSKFRGKGRNGLASRRTEQRFNELFETTLNYDKNFGEVNLALLAGYSFQEFYNEGYAIEAGNFLVDTYDYNNLDESVVSDIKYGLATTESFANKNRLVAFFGRANFNLKETYFLSATLRYEGSSRFGANEKWGAFPAVSAGVTLSNLFEVPAINSLKFRASYGVTGNQPGESYLSLQRVGGRGFFFYNGKYIPAYGYTSNANPNLKWETKNEIDFGLDFSLLDDRLFGSMDWYKRNTKDLILPVNVPVPPNLFGTTWVNIGELENSGFELAANYIAVKKADFSWTTGINLATFSTKVVSLTSGEFSFGNGGVLYRAGMGAPGQNSFNLIRVKEGEELGQLWGPVQIGVNDDGTPKLADLDESGGYCDCDDDKTVIGSGLPDFTLGWNNSFVYKNFDLNFFFRGAFGHDLLNSYRGFYENNETTTIGNYNIVNTKYYDPSITKAQVNSSHVEKADFVRLDNATIGYKIPVRGDVVRNLRFYVSGQNLFTITDYTGVDPEVRYVDRIDADNGGRPATIDDPLSPGIERRSTYFTTRIITLGVNLGF